MSKCYKNPAPLEFTIEDKNGKKMVLKSVIMTPDDYDKFNDIVSDEKTTVFAKGKEQMAVIFGGKAEDYKNVNQLIIKAVIADWSKELETPIPESKEV